MPQNGPKTARFGPLEATNYCQILKSLYLQSSQPAAAVPCGPKRPLKMGISGYFWVFLDILKCGIKYVINPLSRYGLGKHSGAPAPGGRPPAPPKMLTTGMLNLGFPQYCHRT